MAVQLEFLQSTPYFSGLSSDELDSIRQLIFEKNADRGEMVVFEGEPAEVLYFVASGAVKVFKMSAEGKEQILNIMRPGNAINEVSIFDGDPNPTSAQTMGPAVLYGIRKLDLETILQDYPQVAQNTVRVLASRVRHLVSLVEDLSFKHVIGRVAKILIEQAGDGKTPGPRLTQQEIAAMAGTAREVVGRSLKSLEEFGAIRLDGHRIVITDEKALREMTEVSS
jgi:CRP-like cAMP-binding protein